MPSSMLALLTAVACSGTADDSGADGVPVNPDSVTTADGRYMIHLSPSADPFTAGEDITLGMHIMEDGAGVAGLTVDVEPWMVDMDHGISTDLSVTEMDMGDEVGMYEAAFAFSMAGYWELSIDVEGSVALVGYDVE